MHCTLTSRIWGSNYRVSLLKIILITKISEASLVTVKRLLASIAVEFLCSYLVATGSMVSGTLCLL